MGKEMATFPPDLRHGAEGARGVRGSPSSPSRRIMLCETGLELAPVTSAWQEGNPGHLRRPRKLPEMAEEP